MLINTTSVGLNDNSSLIDESLLHSNLLVYDVIYKTGGTALLNLAKSVGASTADGIGMLFYQGILAFQHWAGQELSPELKQIMRDSLEEGRGV
jgi:shikimate dehydrogenase